MNIRPSTSQERRLIFIEALLNATDKLSKVSNNSVNIGVAGGIAKVTGKAEKDIILALSEIFPDLSSGTALDKAAQNFGFTERLGAFASSTYVRVKATPGTVYAPSVNVFNSTAGINFNIQEEITVGAAGFAYVPVAAAVTGEASNVDALTISSITPSPTGHINCINEFKAINGQDIETDEMFRTRIKDGGNILARSTTAMIQSICTITNNKVLKVFNFGINSAGKRVISVVTQTGESLTDDELNQLQIAVSPFLTLSDSRWWGTSYIGIVFINMEYQPIDISFRVMFDNSANPDDVRMAAQIAVSKYFDFRTFNPMRQRVIWVDLLEAIKNVDGIKYVPDQYFYPRADVAVNTFKLPRLRGFLMLDMEGNLISNLTGTLSPVYYAAAPLDFNYQQAVLQLL